VPTGAFRRLSTHAVRYAEIEFIFFVLPLVQK